ncbi:MULTISPECIES: IPTL-CTERM sorting domain-containing protein [unclassified Brevundimonas]|uniref:IPTL-CTERM sorting domain-containing protein n=1 Tax=unclassified Brevundimonas TaxID=2622653 RepID=UPI003F907729
MAELLVQSTHWQFAAPTAVPTTSEWTLWGLTGLLLIGGGVFASRRFRATAV